LLVATDVNGNSQRNTSPNISGKSRKWRPQTNRREETVHRRPYAIPHHRTERPPK
jgi:hypothetical protein